MTSVGGRRKGRGSPRPFRAIAFVPDPTAPQGRRREVAGRIAATTRAGLDRWIAAQEAAGNVVDVLAVLPMIDAPDGPPPPDHQPVKAEDTDTPLLP